jgi:hypothetical protein
MLPLWRRKIVAFNTAKIKTLYFKIIPRADTNLPDTLVLLVNSTVNDTCFGINGSNFK